MPVLQEILNVERPKNSVVMVYGKNKNLYSVRARIGCKRVNGRNIPINGPVIGHIVDKKFVPVKEYAIAINAQKGFFESKIEIKNWGDIVLCDELFKDIYNKLLEVFTKDEAQELYSIAILRVCYQGIMDSEIREKYLKSFLSELYPDVALSQLTIAKLFNNIGKIHAKFDAFIRKRMNEFNDTSYFIIDEITKSHSSEFKSLADFSRKDKYNETSLALLYAFDLAKNEVVWFQSYLDNRITLDNYHDFLSQTKIKNAIIISDHILPLIKYSTKKYKYIHYLGKYKTPQKLIEKYQVFEFNEQLVDFKDVEAQVIKVNSTKNKFLYFFKDKVLAAKEEAKWIKENQDYYEDFMPRPKDFGIIVVESDIKLPTQYVYQILMKQDEYKLVTSFYKSSLINDVSRVNHDHWQLGSEFCDFLASLLSLRLINKFDQSKLLEKYSFAKLLEILNKVQKERSSDKEEWAIIQVNSEVKKILSSLGLIDESLWA